MAEEEVVAAVASPTTTDLKRKHYELEREAPEPNANGKESESVKRGEEEGKEEEDDVEGGGSDGFGGKRPRLEEEEEENPDPLVAENGSQEDKLIEPVKEEEQLLEENNTELVAAQPTADEAHDSVDSEQPSTDGQQAANIQAPLGENPQLESAHEQPSEVELQKPSAQEPQEVDDSFARKLLASETQNMSRLMEVPNNKVGVLIGKGGDTIKLLQINSGAKIQITRDADADPESTTRPVELTGNLENIKKAEKLIKDVIAEADAGGSPSLVARGFSTVQAAGLMEEVLIHAPNEKVGTIIGRGGETIKNLQTKSGARIQLLPQHLSEGDQSKERTIRVSGDKKQIEKAREMINEVLNQPVRQSSSGGYNHQSHQQRGPSSQQQWGSRGPNAPQPTGYDYQQCGPHPNQNSQFPPHGCGNYLVHAGPRSNFGPGWEQRPPAQGPPHQGGGYGYYGGQSQMAGPLSSVPHPDLSHGPGPGPGPGPNPSNMGPPPQGNYNYGQSHGQPATFPAQEGYGHGYGENKFENQGSSHHRPYGGSQPQGSHPGFAPYLDQYGKAPPYGMPPYGPPAQNYGPPVSQPGDVPYLGGPMPSNQQSYGQNAPPPQQTYPYAASGPAPQTYPPYGSGPQPQPAAVSGQMNQQQSNQPVTTYGQPGGSQGPGYTQVGYTGGYGPYPTAQPGYVEQSTQHSTGYGYQGAADSAACGGSAYGTLPTGQVSYAQQPPAQPGYDQSVTPLNGGYVAEGAPAGPAGYGKTVYPQAGYPPYDATQMYAAPR